MTGAYRGLIQQIYPHRRWLSRTFASKAAVNAAASMRKRTKEPLFVVLQIMRDFGRYRALSFVLAFRSFSLSTLGYIASCASMKER